MADPSGQKKPQPNPNPSKDSQESFVDIAREQILVFFSLISQTGYEWATPVGFPMGKFFDAIINIIFFILTNTYC